LIVAAVTAIVGFVGGSAWGTNPFVDVAGNSHEANIDAIYNAGITTGCDTTHYCPNNDVTRAQMATFLARIGGLGKNFPKANAHSDRQTYCAMAEANPSSFRSAPCQAEAQSLGTTGGQNTIAIGTDGFPIVGFYSTGSDLRILHCTTGDCSTKETSQVLDSASASMGQYPSIAIGFDGLPILSYYDASNGNLRTTHCSRPSCGAGSTLATFTIDSDGDVGRDTSIAIGADNFPIISYYDATNGDLKTAHCNTSTCTGFRQIVTLDAGASPRQLPDNVGSQTAIAIGADGYPIVSYFNDTDDTLKVAHCTQLDCTGTVNTRTIGAMDATTGRTAIAVGTDGFAVVAYQSGGILQVAHCSNVACSAAPTITTVDDGIIGNEVGRDPAIAIASDGKPFVAYKDFTDNDLRVAHCSTVDCTGVPVVRTLSAINTLGDNSNAMAIGIDGIAVIALTGGSNQMFVARPQVGV
jgi:hypothetical protein